MAAHKHGGGNSNSISVISHAGVRGSGGRVIVVVVFKSRTRLEGAVFVIIVSIQSTDKLLLRAEMSEARGRTKRAEVPSCHIRILAIKVDTQILRGRRLKNE